MSALELAPERKYAEAVASVAADGRFCGYASLFGRLDLSGDMVMTGAFARSLRRKGPAVIRMLLEHDPDAVIGGWLKVEEDTRGLWVEGFLGHSATARQAGRMMREGRISGLSIGFRTVRSEGDRHRGVRRLIEIELWEISVVLSPMLPEARARAAGAGRAAAGGQAPEPGVDAGLLARMRRNTVILRQTR